MAFDDLNALFRACGKELVRFLTRRVACSETAADLAQEAFLKVMQASPAAPVRDSRAYLFRTASNLAANHRQRQRILPLADDPERELAALPDAAPDAERIMLARAELAALARAIDGLPPRQREVFMLHRLENLHPDEIARRLGISRNMVDKHLRRALVHCLERLG